MRQSFRAAHPRTRWTTARKIQKTVSILMKTKHPANPSPSLEQHPLKLILIVDDDLGFILWLGHMLAAHGYPTVPATNGVEALRLVAELGIQTVDLVIANLMLPGTSELVATLRSRQGSVVVLTLAESSNRAVPVNIQDAETEWLSEIRTSLYPPAAKQKTTSR